MITISKGEYEFLKLLKKKNKNGRVDLNFITYEAYFFASRTINRLKLYGILEYEERDQGQNGKIYYIKIKGLKIYPYNAKEEGNKVIVSVIDDKQSSLKYDQSKNQHNQVP